VAGVEQVGLQPPGEVPAVLDRDTHLAELSEPLDDLPVPCGVGRDREHPIRFPSPFTATSVCQSLCASIPTTVMRFSSISSSPT
jgi:hypothetical protein